MFKTLMQLDKDIQDAQDIIRESRESIRQNRINMVKTLVSSNAFHLLKPNMGAIRRIASQE
jgi:hypothetical protein